MDAERKIREARAELERVLTSPTFARSPNLARLLRFVCEKRLEGRLEDLKEYNIAVEALGRPPDFDPATNSIVRSEMHRLREKLARYYETEAADSRWLIVLPVGGYVPEFVERGKESQGADEVAAASTFQRSTHGGRLIRGALMLGLAVAVLAILGLLHWRSQSRPAAAHTAPSVSFSAAPQTSDRGIRILAGYSKAKFIDRSGTVWLPDQFYEGGTVETRLLRYVARAPETTLFETSRLGEFSYAIPLDPGVYEMRLYFAETFFGPDTSAGGGETSRIFNLLLNGKPLLTQFDPYRDAGGNNIAHVRAFKDVSPGPDGFLRLSFTRWRDMPFVNAIEIIPGTPGKLLPVRIVAQEKSYTDQTGQLWMSDRYVQGGQTVRRRAAVQNTEEPGIYSGERFGNFSYSIPVAPGRYTVRLHFAETFFGTPEAGEGGAGSRVFDVYCNGRVLLKDFDIFRQAGGANRALVKTFRGLEPNAVGQIVLQFLPSRNYACINALEILSE